MRNHLTIRLFLLIVITISMYGCGTDESENDSSTDKYSKAYMSDQDWKDYNGYNKSGVARIPTLESSKCELLGMDELLEAFKSPMRHEWLSSKNFKLVVATGTGKTGDVKKDITNYSNLSYQRCMIERSGVVFNKDGGEFNLKSAPLGDISYLTKYRDYIIAGKQFNLLSEEYRQKYQEVIYEPTKGRNDIRRTIFFVDDIYVIFAKGQNGNSTTISENPATYIRPWKKDLRAGLYTIDGNPIKLESVKNTVAESIDGKDVYSYMSENKNAVIIDLRTIQERTKGVPDFKDRIIHLPNNSFVYSSSLQKLDNSKQYLLLSQFGNSEEAQQLAKDEGLTNFTKINGGFKAMFKELFEK